MIPSFRTILARRAATLPVIALFAIAATACQGVGLTEARNAVDNQRAINDLEERELLPIQRELDDLYEQEILPRERELEDIWDQIRDYENGEFRDAYADFQDPWGPGGPAFELQQEFDAKYAEIDRLYRELEAESRRIGIEQQFSDPGFGNNPAIAALEDERFALQRQLDRLHQFGRRPIEDIYLRMNELNASNGWSQGDIYAADDLNRQIADIQNQIANSYATGSHVNDQNQQELNAIDNELNFLWNEARFPIDDLYNRIADLESQIASSSGGFDAAGNPITGVNPDGTVAGDVSGQLAQLQADMAAATDSLYAQVQGLHDQIAAIQTDAQAQIDELLANGVVDTTEPVDTSGLQAEVDSLNQQITGQQAALAGVLADLDSQIDALSSQIGVIFNDTDVLVADLQAQQADLQAQIDALDTTAEDYEDQKAALEVQIAAHQASIDSAVADETAQVNDLQAQIDGLEGQKITEQDNSALVVGDLQAQIDQKQAEIDAANSSASTSSGVSQEVLDQIAVIESERDIAVSDLEAQINDLNAQIAEIEAPYLQQIAELGSAGAVANTTGGEDLSQLQGEVQALRDQAAQMENDLNDKIRVLEERRQQLMASINDHSAGTPDITHLENELVRLHDELNALQNSGFEASLNYNLQMEEMQNETVRLEKQLSLDIRALEDQLWELDGRIAELYRSDNGSWVDPHAEFNERMKQIELERFELDQRRWELDDEQQQAFRQFDNFGNEQHAEMEARRAEVLDPLHDRAKTLEDELSDLRVQQRDIEDRLREAERSVEAQIRELESQTLDLIDDAIDSAEENAENLGSLEDFDPTLLEGLEDGSQPATDATGE